MAACSSAAEGAPPKRYHIMDAPTRREKQHACGSAGDGHTGEIPLHEALEAVTYLGSSSSASLSASVTMKVSPFCAWEQVGAA